MKPKPIPAEMQAEFEVVMALKRAIKPLSYARDSETTARLGEQRKAYIDARRAFNERWADILDTYRGDKPEE